MNINHQSGEFYGRTEKHHSAIADDFAQSLTQAEIYLQQGKITEATAICYQMIKVWPTCAKTYKLLGNILLSQGQLAQASRCYQTAIHIDPEFAEAYANLGSIAYQQGQLDQAIAHYEKTLKLNPNLTGVYSNLAKVLEQQGRKEEAIAIQAHLTSTKNKQVIQNDWITYFNQGHLYTEQGNLKTAIDCYQKALQLNPNYADSYFNLGIVYRRQGQLNAAIEHYQKAIEIQPNLADAYLSLGNVYFQLFEYAKARDSWQKALKIKPDIGGADVQVDLGNVLVHLNQFDAAITQYYQAVQLHPDCIKAYYNLANLLSSQGKIEEAIAAYQKVLAIDPKFIEGYLSLGGLFEDRERYDEAIATYINILNLQFHESLTFHKLGNVLTKKGNLNDAQIFYSRNIPINLFKKYSPMAKAWEFTSKESPNNQSIYIDIYPRSFHYLSPPQTTDQELHYRFKEPHFTCPPTSVTVVPEGRLYAADYFNKIVFNTENHVLADISTGNLFWLSDRENMSSCEYLDQTVAYVSVKCLANYYHWMADLLPRIELIRQSGIPLDSIDKFIMNPTGLKIQAETLKFLGIPPEKIWVCEESIQVKAKELIIPSLTGSIWYMSKWVCDFLRQQFLPVAKQKQAGKASPEKIYICRESKYRRILNEPEVIAALSQAGFEIIRLESCSFIEQVALFASAKVVMSAHGSGLTNIVFCQPGTKVLELFASSYVVRFYWKLSNLVDLGYYYLIFDREKSANNLLKKIETDPSQYNDAYDDFIINLDRLFELIKLAEI